MKNFKQKSIGIFSIFSTNRLVFLVAPSSSPSREPVGRASYEEFLEDNPEVSWIESIVHNFDQWLKNEDDRSTFTDDNIYSRIDPQSRMDFNQLRWWRNIVKAFNYILKMNDRYKGLKGKFNDKLNDLDNNIISWYWYASLEDINRIYNKVQPKKRKIEIEDLPNLVPDNNDTPRVPSRRKSKKRVRKVERQKATIFPGTGNFERRASKAKTKHVKSNTLLFPAVKPKTTNWKRVAPAVIPISKPEEWKQSVKKIKKQPLQVPEVAPLKRVPVVIKKEKAPKMPQSTFIENQKDVYVKALRKSIDKADLDLNWVWPLERQSRNLLAKSIVELANVVWVEPYTDIWKYELSWDVDFSSSTKWKGVANNTVLSSVLKILDKKKLLEF